MKNFLGKLLQHDKLKHFFFGFFFAFLLTVIGVDPVSVIFFSMFLGGAKEVVDNFNGGKVEFLDFVYTTLPSLFMFLITLS